MEKLHVYEPKELPENIKTQILCFLRIEWPDGFVGPNRLRHWITSADDHPVNFVLEEEGILISHLEVVWKSLEHRGQIYKVYGLTSVFTYPQFRKQGYGRRLLEEARRYIEGKGNADIVMFNSVTTGFYEKAGFTPMKNVVVLRGDPSNPEKVDDEITFMMFLSDKGKAGRDEFEGYPVYVGEHSW